MVLITFLVVVLSALSYLSMIFTSLISLAILMIAYLTSLYNEHQHLSFDVEEINIDFDFSNNNSSAENAKL